MSEYDEQVDDNEIICPYCGDKYQPESETYSEDERIDECDECGKKYHICQSFSVNHHTRPDCEANESDHAWEEKKLRNGDKHDFCAVCGKCKPYNWEPKP